MVRRADSAGLRGGRISTVVFTRIYRKQFGATAEQPTYRSIDQSLIPGPAGAGWPVPGRQKWRYLCYSQKKIGSDPEEEGLGQLSQLLCSALLHSANQTSPMLRPTAAGGFTGADFTPAGSAGVDLVPSTPAVSTTEDGVDFAAAVFTAPSPACTIVWDIRMAAAGTMAGTMDATAGGGVATGWGGLIMRILGGVTRTTETTTTTSLTLPSLGTTAPIRRATILT